MAKVSYKTEDQVRDGAKITLGFDKTEAKVQQGTGQITTFNQLGFKGVMEKYMKIVESKVHSAAKGLSAV